MHLLALSTILPCPPIRVCIRPAWCCQQHRQCPKGGTRQVAGGRAPVTLGFLTVTRVTPANETSLTVPELGELLWTSRAGYTSAECAAEIRCAARRLRRVAEEPAAVLWVGLHRADLSGRHGPQGSKTKTRGESWDSVLGGAIHVRT